jgi:hypothetical protein
MSQPNRPASLVLCKSAEATNFSTNQAGEEVRIAATGLPRFADLPMTPASHQEREG